MFQQSTPSASAEYCLVSDHDSPNACTGDGFITQPTVMMELSPTSSAEENEFNEPQQAASFPYSPTSVNSAMKTGTAQAQDLIDMNFSKTSNLLFFAGSFCQFLVAIWDLSYTKAYTNNPAAYDDNNYTLTSTDEASYLFYTLGPTLYFVKAVLDVRRSVQQARSRRQHELWNIVAGVIFGIGAVLAVYDTILYDAHEDQDDADDDTYLRAVAASRSWFGSEFKMNEIATHLYLVSAAIYLSQHTGCFHGWQQILSITAAPLQLAYRILIGGTICFVTGAIMDALLAYFYDPQTLDKIDHDDTIPATDLVLAKAKLASSFFWNLAPAMYILAEILVQRYKKEHMGNPNNPNMSVSAIRNEAAPFV